jgi:hypothetical protein
MMKINLVGGPSKFIGAHGPRATPFGLAFVVGYAAIAGALVNVPLLFLGAPIANVAAMSTLDAAIVAAIVYLVFSE